MKWLVAPNAFKGTIEADSAAIIIQKSILDTYPDDHVEICPIADGGDGTCMLLSQLLGLEQVYCTVNNPIGRPIEGFFGYDSGNRTAYLDVSTVSGIKWLKEYEKDPWTSNSYGTGELVRRALDRGAEELVIGLGGSATVDMGTGILRAMGILFLDEKGREIPMFSPYFLERIAHIQQCDTLPDIRFTFLCDVSNTYFGEEGAIPVFGPQKGLKEDDHQRFVKASEKLYGLLKRKTKKHMNDEEGYGAAGGIALGVNAFFNSKLVAGATYFFEKVGMKSRIGFADTVITGEGRYDHQSAKGKGSFELLQLAKGMGKKVWLITSGEEGKESGFDHVVQLPDLDFESEGLKENAEEALGEAVRKAVERHT